MTLPGLIDPHVHLREPGQTEKEDFYTGTAAALAGGFTTILDMPNNKIPITTFERLSEKINLATEKTVCDIGFYFGSQGNNLEEFPKVSKQIKGLKLYLNETTGNFLVNPENLSRIFSTFDSSLPILLHAEENTLEMVLKILEKKPRKIHICHISLASELQSIMNAKEKNLPVTCGVTPHHLFLTDTDERALGPFGKMKPSLKSKNDVNFLWQNLQAIDVIESDHAPHTRAEKEGEVPPYGVPGLETTLPLMLTKVHEGKVTLDEVKRLLNINPAAIFNITNDENTYIEVDENEEWTIKNEELFTKCKWSPFNSWKVKGKVKSVFIRRKKVFENGAVLVKPGWGNVL